MSAFAAYDPSKPINDKSPDAGSGPVDPPAPSHKVALGMAMPNNRDMSVLDGFTESNGGYKPALWALWTQWGGTSTKEFPSEAVAGLQARGVTPYVFWEPWDPSDPGSRAYRYERILAGDHDAYIRRFARDAKAAGTLIVLRFAHEANGGHFPWVVGQTDNTLEQYLDAWRRIRNIFYNEQADNVKFLWSVAKQKCSGCNPYSDFYPGDHWVDYMGFSAFNWGDIEGRSWVSMYDSMRLVTNHLSSISDKPIIVAETGTNNVGGDKGDWIDEGYREVYNKLPRIVAIMYLNFDLTHAGHPDWSLSKNNGSGKYTLISSLPQFSGKLTLKGANRAKAMARVKAKEAREARKARLAAKARKQAAAAAPGSRVQKGSGGSNATSGPVQAHKAKTTKKPRRKAPEPPQTLDTLER